LREWESSDYPSLQKAILQEYKDYDSYQRMISLQFLERFKSVDCIKKDNILQCCQQFNVVMTYLWKRGVLSEYTAGVWFLHGLPPSVSTKVVRKFSLDTDDPTTIKYEKIFEFVKKSTAERAIQRMLSERTSDSAGDKELKALVDRYQAVPTIPREELMELQSMINSGADKIYKLTQVANKLNASIGVLQESVDRKPKVQQLEVKSALIVRVDSSPRSGPKSSMSSVYYYYYYYYSN
jgi:hypothetical protein